MTTYEVELEQDKTDKIAEVAARGAAVAADLGQDPEAVSTFLRHYFRHVDAADIDERDVDDLFGIVESHYRAALIRSPGEHVIHVLPPSQSGGLRSTGGATVLQVVTDDLPFLVDSVTMEVLRQGWSIREVFHPQFLLRRDTDGRLVDILTSARAAREHGVLHESWMHLEILPSARAARDGAVGEDLAGGIAEVLEMVGGVVGDWQAMTARCQQTVAELQGVPGEEAEQARELLDWLNHNHFTFLGCRDYDLRETGAEQAYVPVPGTGLGVLRGDEEAPGAFSALPRRDGPPALMVITKGDTRSQVHRPAYLDYIGIRRHDDQGRIVGEHRFLGLFASTAYSEGISHVPVVRQKAAAVLRLSGYDAESHGGKAIVDTLETYPRDELFQTPLPELAATVERIAHLKERRQVRMFVRADPYGRYLSCLVYLPRDRYTTAVRRSMEEVLLTRLGGASIDYTARVTESVLARLHFVLRMPVGHPLGEVDVRALERELTATTRSWDDEFADLLADSPDADRLGTLIGALPEGYKEDYSPRQASLDLTALAGMDGAQDMSLALYTPDRDDDEADLRLKVFRRDASLSLTNVLPHLARLGVDVLDERPYELSLAEHERAWIYDFGLSVPGGADAVRQRWDETSRQRFMDAFEAAYAGAAESDAFNALVLAAGLDWHQVSLLRAVGRYLRQAGLTYSQTYLAQALSANTDIARRLVALFDARFDPANGLDLGARNTRGDELVRAVEEALSDVASLDHDRIVRSYLAVLRACVRTNFYCRDRAAISLKMLPRQIPDLPAPRPAFEIFVYSARVEGVHLRFGSVARGGLRWSDRAEDFRTEVLGLVKAQMVKNTVIVPVGAKGGFYAKRLPDPSVDRDAWMNEGIACYRLFISSLLDITDNIVDGEVVPPADVVRFDGDDPYLVVAADKGTATFSDIANAIAVDRGFWLGDAFASGGSAGYDHKAMGITARGAWESVIRHFRELGVDPQTTDFSCVGIGDMSGDVFGNGMLLSRHTRLMAAFDHRHVFLDPDPDPEASWAERQRLFELPRSSWADYDTSLISRGGGVFPRSLKSVPLTDEIRTSLGIAADVTALSPAQLINAALKAPVDLLWNGGIGTYVKAETETHAEVGDKANDGVRVNGGELRARCVGEGGNLGLTQRGRIEYAMSGGKINTDFIDNSAGVDTSDHEVNIKILLAGEMAAGRLSEDERDTLLASMTDDIAELVLANNDGQNLALANSEFQATSMAGVHEDWMERLEEHGLLDREIEFLPDEAAMEARRSHHRGLTGPELAVLLAYTKIVLADEIAETDLPDDPDLTDRLVDYFPPALRARYAQQMSGHRLHREIVTTVVVNDFVNRSGISCFHRLSGETGAGPADVIRAQIAARTIFGAAELDAQVGQVNHTVPAQTQTALRMEVRTLVERATRWLVDNRRRPIDITSAETDLRAGVQAVVGALPELLGGREAEAMNRRVEQYREAGVPDDLAAQVAVLPASYGALTVVSTARRTELDPVRVARVHFLLAQRLGLDRLLGRIIELPREDRWQTMARAALRDDLHAVHAELTAEVLDAGAEGPAFSDGSGSDGLPVRDSEELVGAWEQANPASIDAVKTLRSITSTRADLARVSVALRLVRGLVG